MRATKLLSNLYLETSCPDAKIRREYLNKEMKSLELQGKDCSNCPGHCCTFEHNSMLIDPLQALELYAYLEKNKMIDSTLDKLRHNIVQFRLDKDFLLGRGKQLRRYYTCPFFKHQACGCPIDPNSKPYGCLAFNPQVENVKEAGHCVSNTSLLENRSQEFKSYEVEANRLLKHKLKLYWDKKPIPVALIEVDKNIKELSL